MTVPSRTGSDTLMTTNGYRQAQSASRRCRGRRAIGAGRKVFATPDSDPASPPWLHEQGGPALNLAIWQSVSVREVRHSPHPSAIAVSDRRQPPDPLRDMHGIFTPAALRMTPCGGAGDRPGPETPAGARARRTPVGVHDRRPAALPVGLVIIMRHTRHRDLRTMRGYVQRAGLVNESPAGMLDL